MVLPRELVREPDQRVMREAPPDEPEAEQHHDANRAPRRDLRSARSCGGLRTGRRWPVRRYGRSRDDVGRRGTSARDMLQTRRVRRGDR